MSDEKRRLIPKWIVGVLAIAFAVYCGGYIAFGDRTEKQNRRTHHFTFIKYRMPAIAAMYVPMAMCEAAARGRFVGTWSATSTREVGWWCQPYKAPQKRERVFAKYSPAG